MNSIQDTVLNFFRDKTVHHYRGGDILMQAYHNPRGISLLLDGVVEQYDFTPEGNKITVNTYKPMSFFPMSWAINKTPNTYFYAALTDSTVKIADADETVSFLRSNPDVLLDLLSRLFVGSDALLRKLVVTANGVASDRLLYELLVNAHRFGTEVDDHTRLVKVKQRTLASQSSLARETVSRELHKLEKAGLLAITKQGIVLDIRRIEEKIGLSV